MKFKLSCGDAMPGCSARFEDESRERILEQVCRALDTAAIGDGPTGSSPLRKSGWETRPMCQSWQ